VADPRRPTRAYRGTGKNNDWLHHCVAALNLRRLLNLGLQYRDGDWALA
jgi:hypothetical protein